MVFWVLTQGFLCHPSFFSHWFCFTGGIFLQCQVEFLEATWFFVFQYQTIGGADFGERCIGESFTKRELNGRQKGQSWRWTDTQRLYKRTIQVQLGSLFRIWFSKLAMLIWSVSWVEFAWWILFSVRNANILQNPRSWCFSSLIGEWALANSALVIQNPYFFAPFSNNRANCYVS